MSTTPHDRDPFTNPSSPNLDNRIDTQTLLENEIKGSFDFFRQYTNLDPASAGFGLTVDSTKVLDLASIAASGFTLSAWVIGVERGYLSQQEGRDITRRSLDTLLNRIPHHHGFFAHFVDMGTGERHRHCEYSTIDTALALNGVITAASYFQDSEISDLAQTLLNRVDWDFLVFEDNGTTLFHMAYNPDRDGDYVEGKPGFISRWDMAAEQKMMYFQAAPRLAPDIARNLYQGFRRDTGYYNEQPIIINPGGNLFAYQFSEAWFDTARYLDPNGLDWFENTRRATLANRGFCMEHAPDFKTYHANSWGASAGDSPWGYDVSGATPALHEPKPNGTVSIYSALASLPYTPNLVLDMARQLYTEHPRTWGEYGFYDAYNISVTPHWYSHSLYGIDKGCSMLMVENYLTGLIWDTYTNSAEIQKALNILGFTRRGEPE